ncbi:bifunctional diaminohydroxyphosphoribosylaminopyrimidine deaminase/5-amino-6-(5-phosphoribosylamino)uracil reductase RibD [Ruficoccus amylovorans]|uniref:Riboflavin biosynthesis protein RibD n=1 Tax=Ruficoccus amylovorans TaxID=1804625 RepID=A0A842HEC6_9BACT|nr:bifunctional diaminohydroxyphosphoribosylaminopyrimidine deaminase/5-amino-6-(5-phosphoribosylamino)uracil reductase RibD [Ruficoccus amylovorans]MBC2594599.1 bifunctional diaminohydroxyphosphoribosylaminopyrimidine deaminase/5-amino-6-(5-phosphoribosylamino)uracil reductase RibD [Ruficoccus amylovorans]
MNTDPAHTTFMRRALALARRGWGKTHPNPMVGALIVEEGKIVAEGWHEKAGEAHAEVAAIRALGRDPKPGATLYVTLEPCSTEGRTPPCTEAILRAGILKIVVGATDPNPDHAGRGLDVLRERGVEVVSGVLAPDCEDLNLIFNHWIVHKRPLVAAKIASTLDGHTATREGHSKWITGEEARRDVHRWRRYFPAIAVGSNTLRVDNPALTSRLEETWCPTRFIFDRTLRTVGEPLPRVYSDEWRGQTIVVTDSADAPRRLKTLNDAGVEVWQMRAARFFDSFLEKCTEAGITGVYVEGGSSLLGLLLEEHRIDYLFSYRAPVFLADPEALPALRGLVSTTLDAAPRLKNIRHALYGDDQLMRGHIVYP